MDLARSRLLALLDRLSKQLRVFVEKAEGNPDGLPPPFDSRALQLLGEYIAEAGLAPDGRLVIEAARELVWRWTDIGLNGMCARGDAADEDLRSVYPSFPAPLVDPDAEREAHALRHAVLVATAQNLAGRLDDLRGQIRDAERGSRREGVTDKPALKLAGARSPVGKSKGRGRRSDTDHAADMRVYHAWKTGHYRTYEELGNTLDKSSQAVKYAIDRVRHRQPSARRKM